MKRKTTLESIAVLALLIIGGLILRQRFQPVSDSDGPEPTPTPRMRALLSHLDPVNTTLQSTPNPRTDTQPREREPVFSETGFLVIQVTEVDGSLPLDDVMIRNPDTGFEQEAPQGRLVLETITGDLRFQAYTVNGTEERSTDIELVTIEEETPAELTLILPEPDPLVSMGLRLGLRENFFEIITVTAGSPAANVGLQPGDAVTHIDDLPAANWDLATASAAMFGRSGDTRTLTVVIEDPPGTFTEHRLVFQLGSE